MVTPQLSRCFLSLGRSTWVGTESGGVSICQDHEPKGHSEPNEVLVKRLNSITLSSYGEFKRRRANRRQYRQVQVRFLSFYVSKFVNHVFVALSGRSCLQHQSHLFFSSIPLIFFIFLLLSLSSTLLFVSVAGWSVFQIFVFYFSVSFIYFSFCL